MDTCWKRVTWGRGNPRQRTSESNWQQPLVWDRAAKAAGERRKVFCASLADVFDPEAPDEWRSDLFSLIEQTENLDWLLLTKRPELEFTVLFSQGKDKTRTWSVAEIDDLAHRFEKSSIVLRDLMKEVWNI